MKKIMTLFFVCLLIGCSSKTSQNSNNVRMRQMGQIATSSSLNSNSISIFNANEASPTTNVSTADLSSVTGTAPWCTIENIELKQIFLKPDSCENCGHSFLVSYSQYMSANHDFVSDSVIGIDIEIRPHNRKAIEAHRLSPMITLVEGSSVAPDVVEQVKARIGDAETVLVLLDSNHSRDHVAAELEAYGPLVSADSYIVACDGIMQQVAGAPRTQSDWSWNHPISAVNEFLKAHPEFEAHEPVWPFNEGLVRRRVTYWPQAYLRRLPVS